LLVELEKVKYVRPGKPQSSGKRKCSDLEGGKVKIWSRMVSLWKLPCWHKLKVRHNLDVMHIEKNKCESLIATILNIPRKTKYTIKARLDLKYLGIKKQLQFRETRDSCQMSNA
jgi:ribosomal protein L24E